MCLAISSIQSLESWLNLLIENANVKPKKRQSNLIEKRGNNTQDIRNVPCTYNPWSTCALAL